MKKATMLAGALAVAGLAGLAGAAETAPDPAQAQAAALSKQDTDFFEDAAQGGLLEVRLGQLAVKQAESEDVRKFGQRMVDDHGKLNGQLAHFAQQKKGLVMPHALDRKHQEQVDKLARESGEKFDHEYMSLMPEEHQKDIKAFEKQAKDGHDPDVKLFAANALPTLQEHLAQAQQIEARIKK